MGELRGSMPALHTSATWPFGIVAGVMGMLDWMVDVTQGRGSAVKRYSLAVLVVVVAYVMMWPVRPFLSGTPTPWFYVAVIIAAWAGGEGPAVLAVALCTLLVNLSFSESYPLTHFGISAALHTTGFLLSALIVTSITTRQRDAKRAAQRELAQRKETEKRFEAVANIAPVLIWISDLSLGCTWVNAGWTTFTGRPMAQELGQGWLDLVHPDDREQVSVTYVRSFEQQRAFTMEYRLRRADGQYRWMLDHGTPRLLPDGSFEGYIGTCIDITVRKEAEEALRRLIEDRHNFIAVMSHELRTPLTAIIGYTELLEEGVPQKVPDEDLPYLERILASARNLLRQVETVLDFQSVQLGNVKPTYDVVQPSDLLHTVLRKVQSSAKARNVKVLLDAAYAPLAVETDKALVEQVLEQLVMNALKFTKAGQVIVSVEERDRFVAFMVSDTGCGIDPEELDKVFEPLYQVRKAMTREVGGMGLGLSMARAVAALLGGSLSVTSRFGQGSTFTLLLPLSQQHRLNP